MRIFAVGRNYAEHIRELNNERPEEPVIFTRAGCQTIIGRLTEFHVI